MDASAIIENKPGITHRETLALYYADKMLSNSGCMHPVKHVVNVSFGFADAWIAALDKAPTPAPAT